MDSRAREEKQKKAKEKKKQKKKQTKIRKWGKARQSWLSAGYFISEVKNMESSTEQRQGDEITGDLSRHAPSVVMLLGSFHSQSAKCEL